MRRLGVVALLVAAASVVVAIGATGVGLLLPPAHLGGGWSLVVRVAGAAAVVAGSAGLLVQRKRLKSNDDRHYDPTAAALVAAAMIMGVLALIARLAPAPAADDDAIEENPPAHTVAAEEESERSAGSQDNAAGSLSGGVGMVQAGPDRRVPVPAEDEGDAFGRNVLRQARGFVLLLVLLAIAALGVLALKGRLGSRREEPPADAPVAATDAEAALEASLDEVAYDGPDPRRQITTAYRRLLAALAAAGAPRQPQEAPHEHLRRALGPLGVQPEPMHALTELYVVSQFSERPITEQHRAAATAALEAGLVSLRATSAATAQPGADTPDRAAAKAQA